MNLNIDIFKIKTNNVVPQKGRVLIAEPFLPGSYFNRAIIFIVEHNDEGTVGLILNKRVDFLIADFYKTFPNYEKPLFVGGPVNIESVYYIHNYGDLIPDSIHIIDDLYWGGNFDRLKELVNSGIAEQNKVRFFLGYSGWSDGQLKEELEDDSWIVADIPSSFVLSDSEDLWKEMVNEVGGKYKLWENFPENPSMN
jgi:putative transcriptional regulator